MGDVTRRRFIQLAAVSAAGAVAYSGCSPFPERNEFLAQSTARIPDDMLTGVDNWYASVCRECRAGCGIVVRVNEGRALKIEGNPTYPVNRGALCARGQSGVQALYHPDRLRGPMRRAGDRGSGIFEEIGWEAAQQELLDQLREASGPANRGSLLAITEPLSEHRAFVIDRLTSALGGGQLPFESLSQTVLVAASRRVFGQERFPRFDIAGAQFLLSFGADFLGTWLSPTQYNRAYGEFRQGRPDRGYFVQVEPRLSQTGASADEWLPINPGMEGALAMSIAQVLVSERLADPDATAAVLGAAGPIAFDNYAPPRIAQSVGIPAERITALARRFAAERPALAIGGDQAAGHTNGLFNLTAIYALNVLSGSVGTAGGVLLNPPSPLAGQRVAASGAPLAEWQQLADRLRTGQPAPVKMLILHEANPIYGLPQALDFAGALSRVPYIVSFSRFMDETTAQADLILPDHHPLETWGVDTPNPAPGIPTVGLQQPVVNPLYDTRDYVDVLLRAARELGPDVQRDVPWADYREAVQAVAQQLQDLGRGSVTGSDSNRFWNSVLQRGGWWDEAPSAAAQAQSLPGLTLPAQAPPPSFAGSAEQYPFHLIVYPHLSLGQGESAYLPWMQATPEPMVTAAWQSWVEVNPVTGDELRLKAGDIVAVASPHGSIEVPVYLYPAIPRDVVAIPLGQGHKHSGRWGKERGANVIGILAPSTDSETGALASAATRVALSRTGRRIDLATYEGAVKAVELEPGHVVQIVRE